MAQQEIPISSTEILLCTKPPELKSPNPSQSRLNYEDFLLQDHCSNTLHTFFDLINTRQFNPTHPFWQDNIDPEYTYRGINGAFDHFEPVSLAQQLRFLETVNVRDYPEFRMEVGNVVTERVKGGGLRSFMECEVAAAPVGFRRLWAAEIKWRENGGRWRVVEIRTMMGVVC